MKGLKSILWKMVIKVNKRIFATVIGISLCVMYLVGTMSMVTGLHEGTQKVAGLFEEGFLIVYDGYTLSESTIDSEVVDSIPGKYAACIIVVADVSGTETRVLYIKDPHNILGGGNITLNKEVLPGKAFPFGNATVLEITAGTASITINITQTYKPYTSAIFPDNWILASENTVRTLNPSIGDGYSFLVIPRENQEAVDYLEGRDYNMGQSVSIVEFFELGFYRVERDLWGVVISSAVIIVILVYNIMKIETQYRVPDIKIIKYIGGSPMIVMYVFISQAVFISCLGAVLGLALGIIAANAIVSASELLGFTSILVPQVNLLVAGLPLLTGLCAGLIGGFLPAFRASKTTIRTSREVL
ncbi:MAG: ABC transporter permease [Thermoplasmata archaeon]|nr:MAG: ABC transporter permease [Thermoplasmata archaeon]